jgi:uncharacterized cofD-like protein
MAITKTAKTAKKTKNNKRLKIVCLGGGNLMPKVVLGPLKKYPVELTGITSMVDSGGASSVFREQFNVLPPADIRRLVLALSDAPEWKKQLWKFRFGNEVFGIADGDVNRHKGQVFGNAFMAGLEWNLKNYRKVIEIVSQFMELGDNRALPMILDKTNIFAELENGQILEGEREIELSENHDAALKIKKIFQKPESKLFSDAKKAILKADLIIIGPGDLYSSIAPCFLAVDAPEVFKKAKGKKILVSNTVSRKGETHGFSVGGFVAEVEKYMGSKLDYVLYHNTPLNEVLLLRFQKENPQISELLIIDNNLPKDKFIGADIYKKNEFAYDSKKVINEIFKLVEKNNFKK